MKNKYLTPSVVLIEMEEDIMFTASDIQDNDATYDKNSTTTSGIHFGGDLEDDDEAG